MGELKRSAISKFEEFCDDLEQGELAALNEALAETYATEWRDISEAPKDGTNLLLFQPVQTRMADLGLTHKGSDPSSGIYTGRWEYGWKYTCAGDSFIRDDYFGDDVSPTHWQPLPEPPK